MSIFRAVLRRRLIGACDLERMELSLRSGVGMIKIVRTIGAMRSGKGWQAQIGLTKQGLTDPAKNIKNSQEAPRKASSVSTVARGAGS